VYGTGSGWQNLHGFGVFGESDTEVGVFGESTSGSRVNGLSATGAGAVGVSGRHVGLFGISNGDGLIAPGGTDAGFFHRERQ
jgi:hypothetical protein